MGDDDTGVDPTELAPSAEPTEAVTAWSLADDEDWPTPRLTPGRITALAVAGALVLLAAAGVLAAWHLWPRTEVTESAAPQPPATVAAPVLTPTQPQPPPSPVTVTVEKPVEVPVPRTYPTKMIPQDVMDALDARFIQALERQGWVITDPAQAARRAHQVCREFYEHETMNAIMARLAAESGLDPASARVAAEQFAYTALEVYPTCERG